MPRNFFRALPLLTALIAPASAADYVAGPSSGANLAGSKTNDNACTGCVGEFISSAIGNTTASVTITIAAPGVITWTGHGFAGYQPVQFTTSGALPTGLVVGTTYYVLPGATLTTNTFELATSLANAQAGTAITTTGTQSGTQTGISTAFMTSTQVSNVTAIFLTAGDWQVWGNVWFIIGSGTTVTEVESAITQVSATMPTPPNGGAIAVEQATLTTSAGQVQPTGAMRVSLSAPALVYLEALGTFGTSTMSGAGFIGARRAR